MAEANRALGHESPSINTHEKKKRARGYNITKNNLKKKKKTLLVEHMTSLYINRRKIGINILATIMKKRKRYSIVGTLELLSKKKKNILNAGLRP